jgi:hypothetical protein
MSLFYVVIYFLKYGQNEQWNMENNEQNEEHV